VDRFDLHTIEQLDIILFFPSFERWWGSTPTTANRYHMLGSVENRK
jgi:hypothetical protein